MANDFPISYLLAAGKKENIGRYLGQLG